MWFIYPSPFPFFKMFQKKPGLYGPAASRCKKALPPPFIRRSKIFFKECRLFAIFFVAQALFLKRKQTSTSL
jgi:hypothetical protein